MPRFNRMRIINFSYNNDTREIVDETFDFYGGENALLNLANGGGKSVLIQLMMQPILPNLKVQKRQMTDYIRHSQGPVFVILEWILDNPSIKDYLMTGIVVAPGSSMQNEDSNRINYFTFASHYDQACEFDLSTLPFVERAEGQLKIKSFERSREAVKKLAAAHREIFYFGREDEGDYRKLLLSFGISQEEWKNIIARMNNDEGGIDDLFERCGTSDTVFNEWIIKNIEKAQLVGEIDGTAIESLLAGLVSDTIKNEEYLKSQKIIGSYLGKHRELEENLEEVCKSLEAQSGAERELSGMYQALKKRIQEANEGLSRLEEELTEVESEQLRIRKEEVSEQYYETERGFLEAGRLTEEKDREQKEISGLLKDGRKFLECYQAARILEDCRRIKGKIEGIKGRIEEQKGDREGKERMDALAYSLRIWCEEQCRELEARLSALNTDLMSQQKLWQDLREREEALDIDLTKLNGQEGMLRSETGVFERYEEGAFKVLETTFLRNILKTLDREAVKKYESGIKSRESREEGLFDLLTNRDEEILDRLGQISDLLSESGKEIFETEHGYKQLEKEWEALEAWKERAGELLIKYELPAALIYEREKTEAALEEKIRQQDGQKNQLLMDKKQISDMIYGIENHCVYLPEVLLKAVERQDITCQTGEAYLGNLDDKRRGLQLEKNPLLPFGLIVRDRDRRRLEEIPFGDCFLRQVIPVFTYEQLDYVYSFAGRIVEAGAEMGLISAYEERIFTDHQEAGYVGQLREQEEGLGALIRHREAELRQLREAAAFFKEAGYDSASEAALEEGIRKTEDTLKRLEKQKKDWKWEQEALGQERLQNEARLSNAQEVLEKLRTKKDVLKEYLAQNEKYEEQYEALCTTREILLKTKGEREEIRGRLEDCQGKDTEIREQLIRTENQLENGRIKLARYQDAEGAALLTESFAAMEEEYELLTAHINDSLTALTRELEDQNKEYEKRRQDLAQLFVREEDYADLIFDRADETAKKAEVRRLEAEEERCYAELTGLHTRQGNAKAKWERAVLEIKKLGLGEPLPREEIRQEYEKRRQEAHARQAGLVKLRTETEELKSDCVGITGRIEDMDIVLAPGQGLTLAEDRREQFKSLREKLKHTRDCAGLSRKSCGSRYRSICLEYKGKNQCVTDILESLANLHLEDGAYSYESVYFSMEEFIRKRESLVKLLDFYEGQLANIVHTKNQIVDQCISYARMIYEDVKLIARKSRVQLSGKSRPVQMLKVGIPEELDAEVKPRMARHIEESLEILTELGKLEDIPEKKWKEKLSLFMSPRELFNQLIGTSKVPVYVYKIDLNEKGSGLKRWEDAMIQNSGGEKVVAFFTMISTLISYIRDVTRLQAGGDARQESKVLIMDNPFGRTSSEHLLKAIMDIARTFHIQLICLSDLSQSSITNRFSLIYQLSVRKRMYSDKEVLKSEPVRINKAGLEKNEKLEHAGVYEMEGQGTLWEFMEDR